MYNHDKDEHSGYLVVKKQSTPPEIKYAGTLADQIQANEINHIGESLSNNTNNVKSSEAAD